jgi:succinate-acetate transporter protein
VYAALNPIPDQPVELVRSAEEVAAAGPLAGDPALLAFPSFIVGLVAIGLQLIGVVPAGAAGAALPVILGATATGMFIAAIWAAAIGQSVVAGLNGTFAGYFLSDALLQLGLIHGWFGITPAAVEGTVKLYLISWLVVVVMITIMTLLMPRAFTVLFLLIDVAVFLELLSTVQASAGPIKAAGYLALVIAAVGAYMFIGQASQANGRKAFPLGGPVL